jgi:hypothetical protein
MIVRYTKEVEQSMKDFYDSLSEKDKRRYAAIEAQKLGRSGITYISKLLTCSRSTIHAGLKELGLLPEKNTTLESVVKVVGAKTVKKSMRTLMKRF